MQLLRHFTIRRVVLWMMILSLAVVALAGSYGALTLREKCTGPQTALTR